MSSTRLRAIRSSETPPDAPDPDADLNTRVLMCPLAYIRDHFGADRVTQILERAGGDPALFEPPYSWISHALFERVLAGVRAELRSDQEFMHAAAYEVKNTYGPLALVFRMSTIKQVYRLLASTSHMVSRISRFEVTDLGRGAVRIRYKSTRPESRLMCLSRQAQNQAVPSMWWGIPAPVIVEEKCISRGDDECSYQLRWKEPVRFSLAVAVGLAVSAVGLIPVAALGWPGWYLAAFGLVGLAVGWMLEARRVVAENERAAGDTNHALLELATAQGEAARELIDLHRRQQAWNQELEALVGERTATLEMVVGKLRKLGQVQTSRVQSLSHDIRNPLTIIKYASESIREEVRDVSPELDQILVELEQASTRIDRLLVDLARTATIERTAGNSRYETVDVATLAASVRRRLGALVLGRDIRPTVFKTREAPSELRVDAILLDRVLDNLLTNAAKYTDRGSILVEFDGTPGHLCMRVSDTGRGISADRLEGVFSGSSPDLAPNVGSSLGLGLSVVVRTLARLAGRVEVMSRPEQGTTFWLYVPVDPPPDSTGRHERIEEESLHDVAKRIIRIREVR